MFLLISKLQHPCISPYINCHTSIRINPATLKDVLFGSRVLTQKQPGDPVSASCQFIWTFPCFWESELRGKRHRSVNVGDYAVGHALAVLLPGQAVLPPALVFITGFSMDKQCGEVDDIEVRQDVVEACKEQQWLNDSSDFPQMHQEPRFYYSLPSKTTSKHSQPLRRQQHLREQNPELH